MQKTYKVRDRSTDLLGQGILWASSIHFESNHSQQVWSKTLTFPTITQMAKREIRNTIISTRRLLTPGRQWSKQTLGVVPSPPDLCQTCLNLTTPRWRDSHGRKSTAYPMKWDHLCSRTQRPRVSEETWIQCAEAKRDSEGFHSISNQQANYNYIIPFEGLSAMEILSRTRKLWKRFSDARHPQANLSI